MQIVKVTKNCIYKAPDGAFYFVIKKVVKIEDVRCVNCNQLLLKVKYVDGEVKCSRCKKINKVEVKQKDRA